MPQRYSGVKELRKNRRNRLRNLDAKTSLRKTIKSFENSLGENNIAQAKEKLKDVFKKLDKAAKRNIIQKNTASRRKSRYSKLIAKK